jgi:hypothetical protein
MMRYLISAGEILFQRGRAAIHYPRKKERVRLRITSILSPCIVSVLLVAASAFSQVAVVKNIKADFGAIGDGAADDSRSFADFNAWAKQWQQTNNGLIELDIPSGSICYLNNGTAAWWAMGIKKLRVVGYGATLKAGPSGGFFLGGRGEVQDSNHSARTATVHAGDNSVTLLVSSKASLFAAGNYALITGFDLQGLWHAPYGYPSNAHFFEYAKVASVNPATGVVTFDAPLKNTYLSTWPSYNSGSAWEVDNGGPATLYALDPSWDIEAEYDGLTIAQAGQTYANGRSITYRDVTFTGGAGGIPTQNKVWRMINGHMDSCWMEVDKLVDSVVMTGTTIKAIDFQSSSINTFTMDSSTVTTRITGTPKKAVISRSNLTAFWPGTYAYGRTDEVTCSNCAIQEFKPLGVLEKGPGDSGINISSSMSNGIIAIPNTSGSQRWAVPGTRAFFSGAMAPIVPFTILDVTQDASKTYVHTDLSGSWPPTALWYQGKSLSVRDHPAPKFTCVNCTGCPEVVSLSLAPAGAPLCSYWKRTYAGNFGGSGYSIWGRLVSIKINVTKPYTGSKATLNLEALGQFGTFVLNPDFSQSRPDPTINMKIAGERVITPAAMTGKQSGDSLTASWGTPAWVSWNVWFTQAGVFLPDLSADDPTTWPSVTIEIITDQGFPNTGTNAAVPDAPARHAAASRLTMEKMVPFAGAWSIAPQATGIQVYDLNGRLVFRRNLPAPSDRHEAENLLRSLNGRSVLILKTEVK